MLKDDQKLQFYDIEKDCNLRLNFQSWEHSAGPKKETSQDLSLAWDQIVSRAKTKLEEELEEKKPLYTKLMDERSKILEDARKLKDDLKQDEFSIMSVREQVLEKEEIIKQQEEVIKTIILKIKTEKTAKEDLEEVLETTKREAIEKRKQVASIENTIKKLDDEMKELSIVNNKKLVTENEKILKSKNSLEEFLIVSIGEKEALLQCPVCFQTASPPIMKCPREHLICSQCLPKMNGKCPTCRIAIPPADRGFRLAEDVWRQLEKLKKKSQEFPS